jgi:hypothetical protein
MPRIMPVAVCTRWRHPCAKARDPLQRREVQRVGCFACCFAICTTLCTTLTPHKPPLAPPGMHFIAAGFTPESICVTFQRLTHIPF